MIYHLSLQTAGIIAGAFLDFDQFARIVQTGPRQCRATLSALSYRRSCSADYLLLSGRFWLLATIEMGEFSAFRRPLLIALPIGYVLVLRFVDEFLAVRALGILCLLAAEPLLDAAFLRYETSRLLVTVFAYLLDRRRTVLGRDARMCFAIKSTGARAASSAGALCTASRCFTARSFSRSRLRGIEMS
mgnify:CR=1 FL=1